jgi:hypothetical protein
MTKFVLPVAIILAFAGAAQAVPITYKAVLSGSNEIPVVVSAGTGIATIVYDNVTHLLSLDITFAGLTGPTTASHIHCCAVQPANAGVATTTPTFLNFPLGVTAGSYVNTLNLTQASSYNPAFVTLAGGTTALAEATLTAGLASGMSYLNIHSTFAPGGEIRGTITVAPANPVPEPATLSLIGFGLAGLVARRGARSMRRG